MRSNWDRPSQPLRASHATPEIYTHGDSDTHVFLVDGTHSVRNAWLILDVLTNWAWPNISYSLLELRCMAAKTTRFMRRGILLPTVTAFPSCIENEDQLESCVPRNPAIAVRPRF